MSTKSIVLALLLLLIKFRLVEMKQLFIKSYEVYKDTVFLVNRKYLSFESFFYDI